MTLRFAWTWRGMTLLAVVVGCALAAWPLDSAATAPKSAPIAPILTTSPARSATPVASASRAAATASAPAAMAPAVKMAAPVVVATMAASRPAAAPAPMAAAPATASAPAASAPASRPAPAQPSGETLNLDLGNGVQMKLVLLPAGTFVMGSPATEKDRYDDESPQRDVTIDDAFYMGVYPVTQEQYEQVMADVGGSASTACSQSASQAASQALSRPSSPASAAAASGANQPASRPPNSASGPVAIAPASRNSASAPSTAPASQPSFFTGPKNPVDRVSWSAAQEFCRRLSEKTGKIVRLPTEAEWEYACRAGTVTRFFFGDDPEYFELPDYAWFDQNSGAKTHAVGQKKPNPWGLYDICGNVWEWCSDYYMASYADAGSDDPEGPASGQYRVLRGGCWDRKAAYCRSAARYWFHPDIQLNWIGFRVVVEKP